MQLCVLASNMSCSSAWTLAGQQEAEEFVNGFKEQDIGTVVLEERVRLLLVFMSTCAENSEYTGLWSENFDSPRTYNIWFSPSPFHSILSHLFHFTKKYHLTKFIIKFNQLYTTKFLCQNLNYQAGVRRFSLDLHVWATYWSELVKYL